MARIRTRSSGREARRCPRASARDRGTTGPARSCRCRRGHAHRRPSPCHALLPLKAVSSAFRCRCGRRTADPRPPAKGAPRRSLPNPVRVSGRLPGRSFAASDRGTAGPCRWRSESSGTSAAISAGGRGSVSRLRRSTSSNGPSNGTRPVSASYSVTPTLYQSWPSDGAAPAPSLRRQVRRRPCHALADGRVIGKDVARKTEIENHDAPVGCDQDVGRLDVAMKLALVVQRPNPVDELPEDVPDRAPHRAAPSSPIHERTRRD